MAKNRYRILFLFLISILVPFSFNLTEACGGGDYNPVDISDVTLFTPELINEPQSEQFFQTRRFLYGSGFEPSPTEDELMVNEWYEFLQKKIPADSLSKILFTDSVPQLQSRLEKEKEGRIKGFYDYMITAKTIGDIFSYQDYYYWWDERPAPDTTFLAPLLTEFRAKMKKNTYPFIKQRYAFQVLRALITLNRYKEAEEWFAKEVEPLKSTSSVYYRAVQYMVRLHYRQKQYEKSNYYTSIVYDQYYPRRRNAYLDFHLEDDKDWSATLAMAKNERERLVLWQLFGMYYNSLEALKQIYAIDPSSELLDLLLVTAVNEVEQEVGVIPNDGEYIKWEEGEGTEQEALYVSPGNNVNGGDANKAYEDSIRMATLKEHAEFITQCKNNPKLYNKCVWVLASSYLTYLSGNLPDAEAELQQAEACAANNDMQCQVNIFKTVYLLSKHQTIDAAFEEELSKSLATWQCREYMRQGAARTYIMHQLSLKYYRQGDLIKSELADPMIDDYYWGGYRFYQSDIQRLEYMEAFMLRSDLSAFEVMLVDQYPLKQDEISRTLGVARVYAGDFTGALEKFNTAGGGVMDSELDPFITGIHNFHATRDSLMRGKTYSSTEFCQRLVELEANTKKGSKKQRAESYFLLGNGLYNITWYGNQYGFGYTFMSGYQSYCCPDPSNWAFSGPFDCTKAREYYKQAMELSKDKEFQAKCAWMIACCDRNDMGSTRQGHDAFDEKSGFYLMETKFKNTNYYKDVIAECGYFAYYVDPSSVPVIKEEQE